MTSSPFSSVELAPRDPILGLTETFLADPRGNKVNLGVGVYYNDEGKVPLLQAVKEAERLRVEAALPRGYLPIEGIAAYDAAVQALLFGADSALVKSGRLVTAQALGGTGALRIGADFLRRVGGGAKVLISDPSWENHRALFESAGFKVETYPYYDAATRGVRFVAMLAALRAAAPGTTVVLHACCHNPTGVDLSEAQWREVVAVVRERGLLAFLDIAYQGFGDGIDADGFAVRLFGEAGLPLLVASSFSKSFSLYGERVGALTVVTADRDEAARVLSQLKR
ncbi:MAG: aromatic amino acid transaminase, partial [Betaproteobacteria bacterium]